MNIDLVQNCMKGIGIIEFKSKDGIKMSIFGVSKMQDIFICFLKYPQAQWHSHQPFIYLIISLLVINAVVIIITSLPHVYYLRISSCQCNPIHSYIQMGCMTVGTWNCAHLQHKCIVPCLKAKFWSLDPVSR